jgi:hypothetical protein
MYVSFSTSCPAEALKRLKSDGFAWLRKEIENNGDDVESTLTIIADMVGEDFRVQDPLMYSSPSFEISNHDKFANLKKILKRI